MPPKHTNKDPLADANNNPLTDAEEDLMMIAVRLDAALWYHHDHPGEVDNKEFVHCINSELVCALFHSLLHLLMCTSQFQAEVNRIYHANPLPDPRYHPIITVIGSEWELASKEKR
jgi:hypothetical protein